MLRTAMVCATTARTRFQHRCGRMEWVIHAIQQTNQRMKTQHITAILTGQTNSIIKSNKADQLPLFGQGKDRSELHWTGVIRQPFFRATSKRILRATAF